METLTLSTREEYELWVLMRQTVDAIRRSREAELKQFGVSRMQAAVLFAVKTIEPPATPTKIARWLFRKSHTVSALLNRMQKQDFIIKTKDLERRNLIRVALTEKGEKAYEQSKERRAFHDILSCLSPKEREKLQTILAKLRDEAIEELKAQSRPSFP